MEDILGAVRGSAPPPAAAATAGGSAAPGEVAIQIEGGSASAGGSGEKNFMADFFARVSAIKGELASVRTDMDRFQKLKEQIVNSPEAEKLKSMVADLVASADAKAKKIAQALKTLQAENEAYQSDQTRVGTSEARIRVNMLSTLSKRFQDQMQEFQEMQSQYREECRNAVIRQIKIINPEADEEELKRTITDDGQGIEVFKTTMLQRDQYALARNRLADIQERHNDIVKLTQSIRELHQLFVDMAVLVESQGELIHQIEYNVVSAAEYVAEGQKQLDKAVEYQSAARRKVCCILIIVMIILVVILAPILSTQLRSA